MKTMYKAIFAAAAVLLLMPSCTAKFEEMNISPNSPSAGTVDPKFQFQFALCRSISYYSGYQGHEQITVTTFCEYDANATQSISDYDLPNSDNQDFWDIGYTTLTNLNSLIRTYENDALYTNLVAMCKIWRAWAVLRLTDLYGDVPFSQACSAEATTPEYDSQESIYKALFTDLASAAAALDASKPNNIGTYDLIYGGDATKWKKFANSLRLRMAVRISTVDKATAAKEAAAAISAGVFESSEDAAFMAMGGENNAQATWNPLYYHFKGGPGGSFVHMSLAYERLVTGLGGIAWPTDKSASAYITDAIIASSSHPEKVDPRAVIQFDPVTLAVDGTKNGMWRGSTPGCGNRTTLTGEFTDGSGDNATNYSPAGSFFYKEPHGGPATPFAIMKYSEVCFLKAIAGATGLASVDAKAAYNAGIEDDFKYYGITNQDLIAAYQNSTSANYYGTTVAWDHTAGTCNTALDKILTQKYIAGFLEGAFEAWNDHRQFHKPTLMPFAHVYSGFKRTQADVDNNTPNAYIKRFNYPSSEQTLNKENMDKAVAKLGGVDDRQKNVWWDKD